MQFAIFNEIANPYIRLTLHLSSFLEDITTCNIALFRVNFASLLSENSLTFVKIPKQPFKKHVLHSLAA